MEGTYLVFSVIEGSVADVGVCAACIIAIHFR